MPTARDQSVPATFGCAPGIDVKPLRIELTSERNDVFFAHRNRSGIDPLSGAEIGEVHALNSRLPITDQLNRTYSKSIG